MVYGHLITLITFTNLLYQSESCDHFATISVKENIPYPSAPFLDVSNQLQAAHITSDNDKSNIYLTDVTGSKPFILTNGKLSVVGLLDREQICNNDNTEQQLTTQRCCSSTCCMYIGITTEQSKTNYIKVNIEDENDNEPMFPFHSHKIQISENVELGHYIALPKAVDLDSSLFGIDRYDIIQDKNCGDCFQVKSETRDNGPALVTKTKIDREHKSLFHLQVLAIDKGVPAKTGTLSVVIEVLDVNDNSPHFEETSILISVEENGRAGREIRTIKVTDADIGINGQIAYSIEDYSSNAQKHFRLFTVRNGVSLQLHSTLDYEASKSYQFRIVARDLGTPSLSSTASVNVRVTNVNDEPPKISFYQRGVALDPNNIVLNLPENGPKQHTIILVHVTDKDSRPSDLNCEVSYPKEAFYLHENQQINIVEKKKLFELQNSVIFDRETTSIYRIGITCWDSNTGGKLTHSVEIQLRITDVNDNAPVFSSSFYFGKIVETNLLDNVVDIKDGMVKVTDADSEMNSRIKFSLADIGNSSDSQKFFIRPDYPQIKNIAPIDYEERKRYVFLIVVKDAGTPMLSSSATITINVVDANDNRPEITQKLYSFSVLEEEPIGTEIGRIEATDADTDFGNQDFIFEILNHDGSRSNSRPNKLFTIENNSGRIKTRVALDHEKDQHINFLVKVRNTNDDVQSNGRPELYASSVSVNVKIIDINDNYPKLAMKDNQNSDPGYHTDALKRPQISLNNDPQSNSNQCTLFPYTFTDADEGINSEVKVSLKTNPHFQLEMGHSLICPKNPSHIAPGQYSVYLIGEDRNGVNGSKMTESLISIVVKSNGANKPQSQTKVPRQDPDDKLSDYKAVIIFIVLIATIILFCFLLMIVVVKTKLCIPRNIAVPPRGREKMPDKQNNSGSHKNYNIIMPGANCENKRLYGEYVGQSLNNQNLQNSDYSNNLFYPRLDTPIRDMGDCQYPNPVTLANVSQSRDLVFPDHDAGNLHRDSIDPTTQNRDLKYEQLHRPTGHSQGENSCLWDKTTNHQYNYLLEPRDSGSLPTNCFKVSSPKQELITMAAGYQKSINDVYLQTSFV